MIKTTTTSAAGATLAAQPRTLQNAYRAGLTAAREQQQRDGGAA